MRIEWTRAAFLDLARIRTSSALFRLRSAADVEQRLRFLNTGPDQVPEMIAAHLQGDGYPGAGFREILYLVNGDLELHTLQFDGERAGALRGGNRALHGAGKNGRGIRGGMMSHAH